MKSKGLFFGGEMRAASDKSQSRYIYLKKTAPALLSELFHFFIKPTD
ncbi:hypothetical protein PBAL39_21910 [Pedobacter sp. BAL39]|nr:hypothetical protein PBAL39_21910 [Pedobacter sp. BAL39]